MVEIILGLWGGSLLLSWVISGLNIFIILKHFDSPRFQLLNRNLAQIDLYWSYTDSRFSSLQQSNPQEDKKKALKQAVLFSLLGLFSVLGLMILIVTVASLHLLARSRSEIAVYESDLALKELATDQVKAIVSELENSR